jgi:hypothetical protein
LDYEPKPKKHKKGQVGNKSWELISKELLSVKEEIAFSMYHPNICHICYIVYPAAKEPSEDIPECCKCGLRACSNTSCGYIDYCEDCSNAANYCQECMSNHKCVDD